jgi:hypothetical protein
MDFKKVIPLVILCALCIKGLAGDFSANLAVAIVALSALVAFQDKNLEEKSKKDLEQRLDRSNSVLLTRLDNLDKNAEEIKEIKSYVAAIKAGNQFAGRLNIPTQAAQSADKAIKF